MYVRETVSSIREIALIIVLYADATKNTMLEIL